MIEGVLIIMFLGACAYYCWFVARFGLWHDLLTGDSARPSTPASTIPGAMSTAQTQEARSLSTATQRRLAVAPQTASATSTTTGVCPQVSASTAISEAPSDAVATEAKLEVQSKRDEIAALVDALYTDGVSLGMVAVQILDMVESVDKLDSLSLVVGILTSFKSAELRLCHALLQLRREVGEPHGQLDSCIMALELPSKECYQLLPVLHLKDQVAGKMSLLLAACHHQRAETMMFRKAVDHLTKIDDPKTLHDILLGLDTWPRWAISTEYSRLFKAEQALHFALPAKSNNHRSNCGNLKCGIRMWLNDRGTGGCAEEILQQRCLALLDFNDFDGRALANLQWALTHWQFQSISLSYTRLFKAKQFLSMCSA